MIEQNYNLNLIPNGVPVVVKASQYDKTSRTINFSLYNGDVAFNVPTGASVYVQGTKPDNTGFQYACMFTDNIVSFEIQNQMTVLSGKYQAEIRITKDGDILGTANFVFAIERAGLSDDTVISETDLPIVEYIVELAEEGKIMEKVDDATVGNIAVFGQDGQVVDGGAAINEFKVLVIESSSFSSLPQTISNSKITSDHVVINSVLSNPSAQTGDWTVTTSNGSLTVSGTISGSTTLTLYLAKKGE